MRSKLFGSFLLGLMVTSVLAVVGAPVAGAGVPAAGYTVQIDAAAPKGEPWAFNRFFPGSMKVHRGDAVTFAWAGNGTPHTASVVPGDAETWRAENQGPGDPYEPNILDTAVGGDDNELIDNPAVDFPSSFVCGTPEAPCSFDGSAVVNSGLQFGDPGGQPSFTVDMDVPVGGYSFLCMIHPGMQIPVQVVRPTSSTPTPEAVTTRAANQVAKATAVNGALADTQAQTIDSVLLPAGQTRWDLNAGGFSKGVTANEYLDDPLTVAKGDRIRFNATSEIHTVTFPESSVFVPKNAFILTQCEVAGPDTPASSPGDCASPADFQIVVNARAIQPTLSSQLTNPAKFINGGLIVGPQQSTFIASRRGTYTFVCLVHGPTMHGTITVT